jgi:hypothetical protein
MTFEHNVFCALASLFFAMLALGNELVLNRD